MGTTASDTGKDYTPAPRGTHLARCCWVIDLGTQMMPPGFKNPEAYKVLLGWEMPTELIPDGDRAGEPYFVSQFYTLSLHEKANLRHDLEAWRGREFTKKELEGFDVRNVLGKPCQLSIIHEKNKSGDIRAKISAVTALPKGVECPEQVNPSRLFVLEEDDGTVFNELPEWVQKMIDRCKERRGKEPVEAEEQEAAPDDDQEVPPF